MNDPIQIRDLSIQDINTIAAIHMCAFPASALSQLGFDVVCRYYLWLMDGPHEIHPLGALYENEMVAYSIGGVFTGAVGGFVIRNKLYLAVRIITKIRLIKQPLFRRRIHTGFTILIRWLKKKPLFFSMNTDVVSEKKPPSFNIASIAVHPEYQRMGIGDKLMKHHELRALELLFTEMRLVVAHHNKSAIRFYEKQGWQKVYSKPTTWSGEMVKHIYHDQSTETVGDYTSK